MKYHFKIHKEKRGYWGECVELKGCVSQGQSLDELTGNLKEALDLYLDEPVDSKVIFNLPKRGLQGRNTIEIEADPQIALAALLRVERLKHKWTQKTVAKKLGVPLYSYQKLEHSKTANPQWKTLIRLRHIYPTLNLNLAA
ncbi:MAG: type II toxin-antitoxin system HicB family antitoxin [Deltaproteobacteria bacterium]|nr:type II toxin-antitoxin system HicB family antitoxin [Deltaproteobacteria bacterium]